MNTRDGPFQGVPLRPMLSTTKALLAAAVGAALLIGLSGSVGAAPPDQPVARMVIVKGKDLSGTVYKKLGLPSLQYCWDTCVKEERCSGARWGVIQGDKAGLCVLLSGELSLKALAAPKTEDGTPIHVTTARKQSTSSDAGT
jgi:hypothetical protein